ncbi:hypothetical protein PC128_g4243 [Phytophthora cactorum]|nr:hypothetical protein PC128_g4243 [Phytophthora cactorum]
MMANVMIDNKAAVADQVKQTATTSRREAPYWTKRSGAEPPPCTPVLGVYLFATTSGSDSTLIVLSLHVDGGNATNSRAAGFGRDKKLGPRRGLSVLPTNMRVCEGSGHMIVKYADGKARWLSRR